MKLFTAYIIGKTFFIAVLI